MPSRSELRKNIREGIRGFERASGQLPGIQSNDARRTFVEQLVDSVRRVEFVYRIRERSISEKRKDPDSPSFDPLRASLLLNELGEFDDACWLVFLSTHCGKHHVDRWKLVSDIYGGDGPTSRWTWGRVQSSTRSFRDWLDEVVRLDRSSFGRFGSHRRYESLSGASENGTGAVVESYVNWVQGFQNHKTLFSHKIQEARKSEGDAFDVLFMEMSKNVKRFGRLGVFDYLCMLEKLHLVSVSPKSPYIDGSTGPKEGAIKLFGTADTASLNESAALLGRCLDVHMQIIEDALCNWQKSPKRYIRFKG